MPWESIFWFLIWFEIISEINKIENPKIFLIISKMKRILDFWKSTAYGATFFEFKRLRIFYGFGDTHAMHSYLGHPV